jgi:hypothetical protein
MGDNDNYFCHTVSGGVEKRWSGFLSKLDGVISSDNEKSVLSAKKDDNNSRQISVANPLAEGVSLEDAVKISDIVNGVKTDFKLFGEHNVGLLSSLVGNAKIETGTFKGVGIEALRDGIAPSIEFTSISPMLVFVFEEGGVYIFTRYLNAGFGWFNVKEYLSLRHTYWEDKKLSWDAPWRVIGTSSTSYMTVGSSTIEESNAKYYLADSDKTYTYIAFGTSGGTN